MGLAEELLSLLEASYDQVSAALYRLVDEGVVIPEAAEDVFRMGEEATALAYYYMGTGDYESAIEKATEALQLFGESLQIALEVQQEPTVDEDVAYALLVELRVRIERGWSRLSERYETLRQLEEQVLNVSDLQVLYFMQTTFLLDKSGEYLESASAMLEEVDLVAVESELAIAEVFLDEAFKLLQTISDSAMSEKASKFAEANVKRLEKLEDRVTNVFGEEEYSEINTTVVQETLQDAKNVNDGINILIESGEIDSAIAEIEKITKFADDVLEMVEDVDEDVANHLKNVERLEAKKSSLEEKIGRLGSKGVETTKFEDKLESVTEELSNVEESLKVDAIKHLKRLEAKKLSLEEPPVTEEPPTEEPPVTEEQPTTEETPTTDKKDKEDNQGENDQGEDDQGEDNQ